MSLLHDMLGKPTANEIALRERAAKAQAHAEDLDEKLLKPDPTEFTNPARHVELCFERQIAAYAWRRALAMHTQLNREENRRYSRGLLALMGIGFASQVLGLKVENLEDFLKVFFGLL